MTKSKWSWWWKRTFQTTAYRDWILCNSHTKVSSGPLVFQLYCLRFHNGNFKTELTSYSNSNSTLHFELLNRIDFEASFLTSYLNFPLKFRFRILIRIRLPSFVSKLLFELELNSCFLIIIQIQFRVWSLVSELFLEF